jgi:hypothetical protein
MFCILKDHASRIYGLSILDPDEHSAGIMLVNSIAVKAGNLIFMAHASRLLIFRPQNVLSEKFCNREL